MKRNQETVLYSRGITGHLICIHEVIVELAQEAIKNQSHGLT